MLSENDTNVLETLFNKEDGAISFISAQNEESIEYEHEVPIYVKQVENDGLLLITNGNWQQAIECFSSAIKLLPSYGRMLRFGLKVTHLLTF